MRYDAKSRYIMFSMFKESNGQYSMRRISAFIFVLASVSCGLISVLKQSEWMVVASAFGIPGVLALAMLICTTVSDVKEIVSAVKEAKQ